MFDPIILHDKILYFKSFVLVKYFRPKYTNLQFVTSLLIALQEVLETKVPSVEKVLPTDSDIKVIKHYNNHEDL